MSFEAPTNRGYDADQPGQFVSLFARHSRRIYAYILTLVPNAADADEVYQDTSMVLWQKFGEFEQGTNFGAWACRVAHFRALSFYKKRRNDRHVFDHAFLQAIEPPLRQSAEEQEHTEARHAALVRCIQKLSERQRVILQQRYTHGGTVNGVASRFNTTANAISKALGRIHRGLYRCIRQRLSSEEGLA